MVNTGKQRTQREIRGKRLLIKDLKSQGFTIPEICQKVEITRNQYFRYQRKDIVKNTREQILPDKTLRAKPLKNISRKLNPLEFCDRYLPLTLKPMQKLILKAFYGMALLKEERKQLENMNLTGRTTWEEGRKFNELVLMIGMKGGKTTLAGIIALLEEYELFKLGDVCAHYGLMPGDRIYIKNVATNEKQAEKTIFSKVQAMIDRSPYYKARSPKLTGHTYHFRDTNVYIESGNANSASLVGDACKLVLLDELDRFTNTKNGKYSAEEVYDALDKSTDPFGMDGRKVSISSLVNSKGFMVDLYSQCKRVESMLGFWMPEWEMQPDRYSGKKFAYRGVKIPIEHQSSFNKNPSKFMRSKGCIIGYTKGAYYRMPDKIDNCFDNSHNEGYKNPIDYARRFADNFRAKEGCKYYMHHDPSSTHDAYAIALGHKEDKLIIIDMIHRFVPKEEGGEIDVDDVIKFCLDIFDRFPSMGKITYDTWAAAGIMQAMKKRGHEAENLYIKISQHDALKEYIYAYNIRCHKYKTLEKELHELIQDGDKVDHQLNGSKDTADAVAGVVWHCSKHIDLAPAAARSTGDKESEDRLKHGFKKIERRRKLWER